MFPLDKEYSVFSISLWIFISLETFLIFFCCLLTHPSEVRHVFLRTPRNVSQVTNTFVIFTGARPAVTDDLQEGPEATSLSQQPWELINTIYSPQNIAQCDSKIGDGQYAPTLASGWSSL